MSTHGSSEGWRRLATGETGLVRAARDRHARLAAGLLARAGAAIVATRPRSIARENGGAEPVEDRAYRMRRKEPAPDRNRRVAQGRADDALEQREATKGDLSRRCTRRERT